MPDALPAFSHEIERFPPELRPALARIPELGGVLEAREVHRARCLLGMETPRLMVALLPLAAAFAHAPISGFRVGAIAAGLPGPDGAPALYLGANFEVAAASLALTLHAEQSATVNAWLHGEGGLSSIAISAAPCGYCRQFLYELNDAEGLEVVQPFDNVLGYRVQMLTDLLPDAFGPADLGISSALMAPAAALQARLTLAESVDALERQALEAARCSYAPYTGALAGCAIQTADGAVFVGRSVENAAYNPGLSAVQVAFSSIVMHLGGGGPARARRVVLVEHAASVTQRHESAQLARALAPDAEFLYRQATFPADWG